MQENSVEIWKEASNLFAQIAEMPVDSALSFLDNLPELDLKVRNAVITLINAESQSSEYFTEKIAPVFQSLRLNKIYKVGQVIDKYELLEELGRGGMSQVFKAIRLETKQQKPVAIKIFSPTQRSTDLLNHFINEQKLLSQLSHPNIVDMLHGGTTQDDIAYLTMALVEKALPIDLYCKSLNYTVKQSMKLIVVCANALAYLHSNLIIHRDLKPDNILIDEKSIVKIVDFGIAKLINNDLSGNKTTLIALTPSYAAPEQIQCKNISVKVDIFSLAVIALDILSECKPLPKTRLIKACADDEEYIEQLVKSLKVDKDLKNILIKGLQQIPINRYQTMNKFSEDLQAWLDDKPVSATGNTIFYQISKFAKRRKALFASLSTLLITMLLAILVVSWQYQETRDEKQKAIEIKDFMLNLFSSADPEKTTQGKLSALDLLLMAEKQIEYRVFKDEQVRNDLLTNIGTSFFNLGAQEQGEKALLSVLKKQPNNVSALLRLTQYYVASSQEQKIRTYIQRLDAILTLKPELLDEGYQLNLLRAIELAQQGNNDEALVLVFDSLKGFEQLGNNLGIIKSTRVLTGIYEKLGNIDLAIKVSQKTINSISDSINEIAPDLLRLRVRLAMLQTMAGQQDKVIESIDDVIDKIAEKLGSSHPLMITTLVEKANIYTYKEEYIKALETANKANIIAIRQYGKDSRLAQHTLYLVTMSESFLEQHDKALSHYQRLMQLSVINYGKDNQITQMVVISYAYYLARAGKKDQAIRQSKYIQKKFENLYGEGNELSINAKSVYIDMLSLYSNPILEDVQMAKKNHQIAVKALGESHPQTEFAEKVLNKMIEKISKGE